MATLRKKVQVDLTDDFALIEDGAYVVKDWTDRIGSKKTIKDMIERSKNSRKKFMYVDLARPCDIMAKSRNDGSGIFLKMKIYLTVGGYIEYDLSYRKELSVNKYEEGDEIDPTTLEFFVEEKLGDVHPYATGKVMIKDEADD